MRTRKRPPWALISAAAFVVVAFAAVTATFIDAERRIYSGRDVYEADGTVWIYDYYYDGWNNRFHGVVYPSQVNIVRHGDDLSIGGNRFDWASDKLTVVDSTGQVRSIDANNDVFLSTDSASRMGTSHKVFLFILGREPTFRTELRWPEFFRQARG